MMDSYTQLALVRVNETCSDFIKLYGTDAVLQLMGLRTLAGKVEFARTLCSEKAVGDLYDQLEAVLADGNGLSQLRMLTESWMLRMPPWVNETKFCDQVANYILQYDPDLNGVARPTVDAMSAAICRHRMLLFLYLYHRSLFALPSVKG